MSNRSLLEFNHDHWEKIETRPQMFAQALSDYLRTASPEHAERLERYGVRVFGMRHHSDNYSVKWGAHSAEQK